MEKTIAYVNKNDVLFKVTATLEDTYYCLYKLDKGIWRFIRLYSPKRLAECIVNYATEKEYVNLI